MRLGLYAPRRSSFWIVGPLARAATERGHDVVFLTDTQIPKPGDTWCWAERTRDFPSSSQQRLRDFSGDWIASPPPSQNFRPADDAVIRIRGVKLCSLDAWTDTLNRPFADNCDLVQRTVRHGYLPTDGLRDVVLTHEAQTIVWYVPKTLLPGYVNRAIRMLMIIMLARELRRTAERTGVSLILKVRSKIRLPRCIKELAHIIIGDPSLYPHTSLKLLGTAALTVSHQSAAGTESVAAGVRALSVSLPHRHLRKYPLYSLLHHGQYHLYAWPGVIDAKGLMPALRWLMRWTPTQTCEMEERAAYIDTWLGGRVMGTSDWLLDEMEKRCC